MIRLFVNALAASAGSGPTYIRNLVPWLSRRTDLHTTLLVPDELRRELGPQPNLTYVALPAGSALRRFLQEQRRLPELIRQSGADVLLSAGNFALRNSPIPQILLSGNSLYTSADFTADLWRRREYGMLLENAIKSRLARASIHWANCTVAPSEAFAGVLRRWAARDVRVIAHGFDAQEFRADPAPLDPAIAQRLAETQDCTRLLFVSHYNYYRNFETLLRALPLLRERLAPRRIALLLTCKLAPGQNPGNYDVEPAARLVEQLCIADEVIQLGAVPYRQLHHLYRAAILYVTPAYTETFAHPLVEAMASGLPVVASGLPVHREVCSDAGVFFDTFSSESLASAVASVLASPEQMQTMSKRGLARATHFSWQRHAEQVLELAESLIP